MTSGQQTGAGLFLQLSTGAFLEKISGKRTARFSADQMLFLLPNQSTEATNLFIYSLLRREAAQKSQC